MATLDLIRKGRPSIYYNTESLQTLCKLVVFGKHELERELFLANPYGVKFTYSFEMCLNKIYWIIGWRYITSQQSFERWFRKLVKEKMDLIEANKRDLKFMIKTAESLEKIMLKFKKLFGIALEVFEENEKLLFLLRRMQ